MAKDSAQWKYPHVSVAKRRTGHRLCVWANYSWRALAQILSLAYPSQNFPLSISVGGEISASCTRPWLYPFHPILSAHRKKALSLSRTHTRTMSVAVILHWYWSLHRRRWRERAKVGKRDFATSAALDFLLFAQTRCAEVWCLLRPRR